MEYFLDGGGGPSSSGLRDRPGLDVLEDPFAAAGDFSPSTVAGALGAEGQQMRVFMHDAGAAGQGPDPGAHVLLGEDPAHHDYMSTEFGVAPPGDPLADDPGSYRPPAPPPHPGGPHGAGAPFLARGAQYATVHPSHKNVWVIREPPKRRLRWSPELHEKFLSVVNDLGGCMVATPKAILKRMGEPGMTIFNIKSHLQKYRAHVKATMAEKQKNGTMEQVEKIANELEGKLMESVMNVKSWADTAAMARKAQLQEDKKSTVDLLLRQLRVQHKLQREMDEYSRQLQDIVRRESTVIGADKAIDRASIQALAKSGAGEEEGKAEDSDGSES